jgi:hypothetical protein
VWLTSVSLQEYRCSCFFAQIRLLPCRHVLYYRTFKNYESVIPFKFIHPRWSLRNPCNNIGAGEIRPGGYMVRRATRTRLANLSQGDRFCKAMAFAKPMCAAISVMPPAQYEASIEAMKTFCSLLERGVLPRVFDPDEAEQHADQGCSPPHDNMSDTDDQDQVSRATDDGSDSLDHRTMPDFHIPKPTHLESARARLLAAKTAARMAQIREEANRIDARRHRDAVTLSLADVEATVENAAFSYETAICLVSEFRCRYNTALLGKLIDTLLCRLLTCQWL